MAGALDIEDEVIPHSSQFHLALELVVSQALPADGVFERIDDYGLHLALVAFVPAIFLAGLSPSNGFKTNNPPGEAFGKLLRIVANNRTGNFDIRQQTVRRSSDRRELCVIRPNTLDAMEFHLDLLARTKLGDQDVGVHGLNNSIADEKFILAANRAEDEILGVDMGIVIQFPGILLAGRSVSVLGTFDI